MSIHWQRRLERQQEMGLFRAARARPEGFADFCSNDFLGLAQEAFPIPPMSSGGTGSRLISGLHESLIELESWAADFFQAERAVYFPSGYQANLAVLNALTTRHDHVLMDERIHASFHDASRLTLARKAIFRHNDLPDLRRRLEAARSERSSDGDIYVVTEGVFSMAATHAPLKELATLCAAFGAVLMVDEAHSIGLYGREGRGLADELKVSDKVAVRVFPLGKAAGSQGALVVGSAVMGQMLENFGRPLIFSTSPSPVLTSSVLQNLKAMKAGDGPRQKLAAVERWVDQNLGWTKVRAFVPIQPEVDAYWPEAVALAEQLRLWVKPIRYPTVPKGEECFRLTLHAFQSEEELLRLAEWVTACHLRPLRLNHG